MTMEAEIAQEAQKLATDKLIKLYKLDLTAIGGDVYRFVSAVDTALDVSSLTSAATLATCVTNTPHTMMTGDAIRVVGATPSGYNGDFTVTVTDPNTFTFNLSTSVGDGASGGYLRVVRLNNKMIFDGDEYAPVAFEATGFEINGQGSLPNPKIRIDNVNKVLLAAAITMRDCIGATFTRIRTFRKHLDDGSDPDPSLIFPLEVYQVHRKTAHNKFFIEWELAASVDQEGAKIPKRQALKTACTHIYRKWDADLEDFVYTEATCPYTGSVYFDNKDMSTSDPSMDRCSKLLSGCVNRFGSGGNLPTRAFPGIGGR